MLPAACLPKEFPVSQFPSMMDENTSYFNCDKFLINLLNLYSFQPSTTLRILNDSMTHCGCLSPLFELLWLHVYLFLFLMFSYISSRPRLIRLKMRPFMHLFSKTCLLIKCAECQQREERKTPITHFLSYGWCFKNTYVILSVDGVRGDREKLPTNLP